MAGSARPSYAAGMAARLVAVVVAVLVGCSTAHRHADDAARGGRPVLSHGYAPLYEMVRTQRLANKVLLVKSESEDVKRIVGRIADHAADAKARLETEQVKDVLARSGKDFERTLVVVLVGFVQQERHLARAMVDAETDANRRRSWTDTQRRFDAEYADALALLERRYFR